MITRREFVAGATAAAGSLAMRADRLRSAQPRRPNLIDVLLTSYATCPAALRGTSTPELPTSTQWRQKDVICIRQSRARPRVDVVPHDESRSKVVTHFSFLLAFYPNHWFRDPATCCRPGDIPHAGRSSPAPVAIMVAHPSRTKSLRFMRS